MFTFGFPCFMLHRNYLFWHVYYMNIQQFDLLIDIVLTDSVLLYYVFQSSEKLGLGKNRLFVLKYFNFYFLSDLL